MNHSLSRRHRQEKWRQDLARKSRHAKRTRKQHPVNMSFCPMLFRATPIFYGDLPDRNNCSDQVFFRKIPRRTAKKRPA